MALSKAILATAERPEPSVPTTTPSPRVACMTRSPTVSDSVGASSSAEDAFPEPPLEEDLADVSTPNPPGLDPFEPRPVEPAPLKLPRLPEAPPLKLPRLPAPPRLPEPPRPPEPPRLPEPHDPEVPDPMIGPPSSSPYPPQSLASNERWRARSWALFHNFSCVDSLRISTASAGRSSRNRDGGMCSTAPQALRVAARVR